MDAKVYGAGNGAELVEKIGGEDVVRIQVGAGDLNVDGRGKAEVQNLTDNIRRQEVEGNAWKFPRQLAAQFLHISTRGPVAGLESDQDVRIHGADRGRIAIGHV